MDLVLNLFLIISFYHPENNPYENHYNQNTRYIAHYIPYIKRPSRYQLLMKFIQNSKNDQTYNYEDVFLKNDLKLISCFNILVFGNAKIKAL